MAVLNRSSFNMSVRIRTVIHYGGLCTIVGAKLRQTGPRNTAASNVCGRNSHLVFSGYSLQVFPPAKKKVFSDLQNEV